MLKSECLKVLPVEDGPQSAQDIQGYKRFGAIRFNSARQLREAVSNSALSYSSTREVIDVRSNFVT